MGDTEVAAELERCAAGVRALLWRPDVEVVGVSTETSGRLGHVLLVALGAPDSVRATSAAVVGPVLAAGATGAALVHT